MSRRYPEMRQVIAVDEDLDIFTRAWCIAEIHMAHKLKIAQSAKLHDLDMVVNTASFDDIKIEACKASRKEDVDEILSKIDDKEMFNQEVKTLFSDPTDGILANPFAHKARELAGRSIRLDNLLQFYSSLGKTMMPHYSARLSTTYDVVRQAIIPGSVIHPRDPEPASFQKEMESVEPSARGKRLTTAAYSTMLKPWGGILACCFVSQNWSLPFAKLIARIAAHALNWSTFNRVFELLCEREGVHEVDLEVMSHKAGSLAYWFDPFCINHHNSICEGIPRTHRDTITGEIYPGCACGNQKVFQGSPEFELCEMNKFQEVVTLLHKEVPSFRCIFVVDSVYLSRCWCVAELIFSMQMGISVEGMVEDYNGSAQCSTFDALQLEGRREDTALILDSVPNLDELLCKRFGWVWHAQSGPPPVPTGDGQWWPWLGICGPKWSYRHYRPTLRFGTVVVH